MHYLGEFFTVIFRPSRPLRLCARYSGFWSRLCRAVLFVVNFNPLSCLSAQEPLRAGTIFSATQAPLWAAIEGRYFEKYGIKNLEVIQFSGQWVTSARASRRWRPERFKELCSFRLLRCARNKLN